MPDSKAVIWDMDGVIASTAPYHFQAWQEVFQERGVNFTEAEFSHHFGQRNDTIIKSVLGDETPPQEIKTIANEKEISFRKYVDGNVRALPGVIELMTSILENGFKMAIGSSAPVENIRLITSSLGIAEKFHVIISGHEVAEGKPDPQVFLLAASRLEVEPEYCIVIEDSVAGITAARRAGMHSVAVTNTHPGSRLGEADFIVDSLATVSITDSHNVFK